MSESGHTGIFVQDRPTLPLKKTDRRVEKTRNSLTHALISLMIERGYEEVTVQHILDKAGVGRSTFYAHFRDKEALLRSSLDNMKAALQHHWKLALEAESTALGKLGFALPFLRHLDSHREIWAAIVGRDVAGVIDRQMRRMLAELARIDLAGKVDAGVSLEAAVQFVVGAFMSLVAWWLDYEVKLTPSELNDTFVRLALAGLGQAPLGPPDLSGLSAPLAR
jgi:AcrR family transcriptional regulator